jgi:simple sugar transport system ATP-binding protein
LPVLELRTVSKFFGAIHALNDVDLSLDAGEVLGLMGDNGAGKSTLVRVIAGNFPPTHGDIRIADESVHFTKPAESRAKGVEVVY